VSTMGYAAPGYAAPASTSMGYAVPVSTMAPAGVI
jgi:hypothetical protein